MTVRELLAALARLPDYEQPVVFAPCEHAAIDVSCVIHTRGRAELVSAEWSGGCGCACGDGVAGE